MMALTPLALVLLAICVTAETLADIGYKASANAASTSKHFVQSLLSRPLIWITLSLSACEVVVWVLTLQRVSLSVAYPFMTLTYATVPLASILLLRERMSRKALGGALLVALGVVITTLPDFWVSP